MAESSENPSPKPQLLGVDNIKLSRKPDQPGSITFKEILGDIYRAQMELLRGTPEVYFVSKNEKPMSRAEAKTKLLEKIDGCRNEYSRIGEERAFASALMNARTDFETLQNHPELENR